MSTSLNLFFTEAAAVATGQPTTPSLEDSPSTVALAAPAADPAFPSPLTHGWRPAESDVLRIDGTASAETFGEFALDIVLAGVSPTREGSVLSGVAAPARVTVGPSPSGGVRVFAAVATTGAPVALIADIAVRDAAAILRAGVWVTGGEAGLAIDGVVVTRRRFARAITNPAGDVTLGASAEPALPSAEATVVGVSIQDQLSAAQEAALADAASTGLGEIDSLVESGTEGFLGAPTDGERTAGRVRFRTFEKGVVYWSAATGAHAVRGDINAVHAEKGGITGTLGLPVSAELGLDDLLDQYRVRPTGRSGLTAWDVLKHSSALTADSAVLAASDATLDLRAAALTPKRGSWERLATEAATPVVLDAARSPLWRIMDTTTARAAATAAVDRLQSDTLAATPADVPLALRIGGLADRVALRTPVLGGGAGGVDAAPVSEGFPTLRGMRSARPGVSALGRRVNEEVRIRRPLDPPLFERTVPVDRPVDLPVDVPVDVPVGPIESAVDLDAQLHAALATALGDASVSLVEASMLAPHAFIENATLSTAITAFAPAGELTAPAPESVDIVRSIDEAPKSLVDLIQESSRLGVEINLKVDDLGYILRGPRAQMFQHGIVISTAGAGAIELYDEILAHWLLLGASRGFLGAPQHDQISLVGGAYGQFGGGRIYWSAATGAHEVHGAILGRYFNTDGTDRKLGFPTTDELDVPGSPGAKMSSFERGVIFWTPQGGPVVLTGVFLDFWRAGGGLDRYGLPTGEMQSVTRGGVELRWQTFEREVVAWTSSVGCFDQLEVRISRVAAGNIDDGLELSGFIPREDTTAELIVRATVWIDGQQVFSRESGRGGSSVDFSDWVSPRFTLTPTTTVRLRIEATDWDEASANDRLAERDVTLGIGDDFWGYTRAWGSHLQQPSTDNDSDNAGPTALTFDYSIAPPFEVDIARMRRDLFWRFSNKGRDHLPWRMYKETFIDIDGEDVNYLTDPLDSWYYESSYEDVADGGNCFGYSVSTVDAFFRRGVVQPLSQQTSDQVDDANWRLINRGQGSQKAASMVLWKIGAKLSNDYCDPRRVWARAKASTDAAIPLAISLRGFDDAKDEGSGHSVLAYRCEQMPDGTKRMYIADSNRPYADRWESDDSSMIEIAADGSYKVQPVNIYGDYAAPAFESGSLGKRYMMDVPSSVYTSPLRTPVWDSGTALACAVGGVITSDGAAITQVEAGGRRLLGDQRRRLLDDLRAQSTVVEAAASAGLIERAVVVSPAVQPGDPGENAADPGVELGLRAETRLLASAQLLTGTALTATGVSAADTSAALSAAIGTVPGAAAARSAWGSVSLVSSAWADTLEADLRVRPEIDAPWVITPGSLPDASFVHGDDDRGGSADVVAFRGSVPDEVLLSLRGRGRRYHSAMLGGGGLIRLQADLERAAVDTVTAQRLAGARPGLSMASTSPAKVASVTLDSRARVGALGWSLSLGVGGGSANASVRWLAGRPGLRIQHAAPVPAGRFLWSVGSSVAYTAPAAQAGEIIRIAPHDPGSPLGAVLMERLNVVGDLLQSEIVDPVG